MSHVVTISTQIRDPIALAAACRRLGLQPPEQGTAQLFAGLATGLVVKLPHWLYPVVVDSAGNGKISYDNYAGAWGAQVELDKLMQAYAIEKARLEARRAGHTVTEQALPNGSVKLTIQVGGAA